MGLAMIQEVLDLSSDEIYKIWRPCIICSGEVEQIRKAFFKCKNCKQDYIAEETDMMI